jgi:hypothetical protein
VNRQPGARAGLEHVQAFLPAEPAPLGSDVAPRVHTPSPGAARPQVAREGTKKTVFTNFMELCKAMNRQLEHVQLFLLAELGTSGNLDGQSRLIVKGRFLPKAFEGVLRRYVNECGPLAPRAPGIEAFELQQVGVRSVWLSCCAESLEPRLCDMTACSSAAAPAQCSPNGVHQRLRYRAS